MGHLQLGGIAVLVLTLGVGVGGRAEAVSMKECSVKYKSAKAAGTLNGEDWKAFRAAQCSGTGGPTATEAAPGAAAAGGTTMAAADGGTTTATSAPATVAAPDAAPTAKARSHEPAVASGPVGNATFPTAVDAKYSKLSAGRARMKTCDDQYKLNKASGGNGGMKWNQKGGGYYSACNKRLKGA